MRFTSIIIQPDHYIAWKRSTIEKNLNHYLELIDFVCKSSGTSTLGESSDAYAPLKLIAFPEFFLQGFNPVADLQRFKKEIAIKIPGKETAALGKMAKKHNIFICGQAFEIIDGFDDTVFNCVFIIDPNGDVIHKYHKINPAIQYELSVSPHDVFDEYMNRFGKGKTILETFFPVTDTEIGKIGTFTCMDGHLPEISRALTMNGAEILIRPTAFPEPLTYEPRNWWETQNRTRAHENLAYVIAPNTGGMKTDKSEEYSEGTVMPRGFCAGDSMIVDFEGQIIGRAPYPGETIVNAVIDLNALRARRLESSRNFPTILRNELFSEIYKASVYPANLFNEVKWTNSSQIRERSSSRLGIIESFIEKGIYQKP